MRTRVCVSGPNPTPEGPQLRQAQTGQVTRPATRRELRLPLHHRFPPSFHQFIIALCCSYIYFLLLWLTTISVRGLDPPAAAPLVVHVAPVVRIPHAATPALVTTAWINVTNTVVPSAARDLEVIQAPADRPLLPTVDAVTLPLSLGNARKK